MVPRKMPPPTGFIAVLETSEAPSGCEQSSATMKSMPSSIDASTMWARTRRTRVSFSTGRAVLVLRGGKEPIAPRHS